MMRKGRQFGSIGALLGVVLFTATVQISGQDVSTSGLRDAAQSLAAGNLERADHELQLVLRSAPGDYRALDLMGVVRVQQHREPEAEKFFQNAIRQKPDVGSAHVHLGLLYMQTARREKAVVQLREGLRLDPTRTDASAALSYILRGDAWVAATAGDFARALGLLIDARKLTPENPDVQFAFGMVAMKMSLLPDAIDAFRKTLKLRPDDPMALYGLGRALMGMSEFEDAREPFARYTEMRPKDASGYCALGMTLAALERSAEARIQFEKSIAITPAQTESYYRMGLLDLEARDLDSAAKNFHRVLDRDPKRADTLTALGRVEFERKQFAEAADLLQRALASDDSLREAHYYLGLTFARMGRKQESEEQLGIATRLEHDEVEKHRTILRIEVPEGPLKLEQPVSAAPQ